jgi:hypothetical protein
MPLRRFILQSTELAHTVVDIAADASQRWRDDHNSGSNGQPARPLIPRGGGAAAKTT